MWHVWISICEEQGQGHRPFIKQVIKVINNNSSWKESLNMKGSKILSEFFVIVNVPADKFPVSAVSGMILGPLSAMYLKRGRNSESFNEHDMFGLLDYKIKRHQQRTLKRTFDTTYFMMILANASDSGSTPCSNHFISPFRSILSHHNFRKLSHNS